MELKGLAESNETTFQKLRTKSEIYIFIKEKRIYFCFIKVGTTGVWSLNEKLFDEFQDFIRTKEDGQRIELVLILLESKTRGYLLTGKDFDSIKSVLNSSRVKNSYYLVPKNKLDSKFEFWGTDEVMNKLDLIG